MYYGSFLTITTILPIALALIGSMKIRSIKPALLGAVCFSLIQLGIRLPLLRHVLPMWDGFARFQIQSPILFLGILSLSAGVMEECGRYAFMYYGRLKEQREGILFGIGHGGTEALSLVGIDAAAMLFAPAIIEATPNETYLMASVERIFAMTAHVGLSLLVLYSVLRKRRILLLLAVGLHTVYDFGIVYIAHSSQNYWLAEGAAGVFSLLIAGMSLLLWKKASRNQRSELT